MKDTEQIKKVVFYTGVSRLFRTTLIGYLYKISQVYPIVLLSEKLDPETEELVNNREIFPKIEKIIPVNQYGIKRRNLLLENIRFYKLAKSIVLDYKPDIVISGNDLCHFEIYLMRFAKKAGALNICFQGGVHVETKKAGWQTYLLNAHFSFLKFLPFYLKIGLLKIKRYFGHFVFYWALPLMVGEMPFKGKSSIVLWRWVGGLRDAHYSVVFSKKEYDSHIKDGVSPQKLYILSHPLARETRSFFDKFIFNKEKARGKTAVLMLPLENVGFKRSNYLLIDRKRRERLRMDIVNMVSNQLKGWQIFIKPHPAFESIEKERKAFESLSGNIKVVSPSEPADKYIDMSDLVIGLPPSNTTTLYTASLESNTKPVLALDFDNEFLGDIYKDCWGIEYIDSQRELVNILALIRNNKYQRRDKPNNLKQDSFNNVVELIEYLYERK